MSHGYDEFESKLGQFIYTMVMYERLREYLLEKLRGKDRVSVRINLGTDKFGNHVFMDVVLTSVTQQLFTQQIEREKRKGKKSLVLVLTNDEVSGDNHQISSEMEKLIIESLKWWHSYFGERDKLNLNAWKSEKVDVLEGEVLGTFVEIPVHKIMVPPPLQIGRADDGQEVLEQFVDILSPIIVRPTNSNMYELVGGLRIFDILVNRLGHEHVRALVLNVDDEQASSIRREIDEKIEKLVNTILNK